jgi:DnaK suppressor protein
LSQADLRHFAAVLRRDRAEALQHAGRLEQSMADVRGARSDATADDEHDPEGPTMSQEWAQLSGLTESALAEVNAIERALQRIRDRAYGTCARCARPIGRPRLDARPTAELCIDCARAAG